MLDTQEPPLEIRKKAYKKFFLENNSLLFSKYFYKAMNNKSFIENWHHKVICEHLDKVLNGEIKRLIINIPPRYSKTELIQMFVARGFAVNPASNFIYTSYSDRLVLDCSANVRNIIKHEKFQEYWPIEIAQDTDSKRLWRTKAKGGLYSVSMGGQITGFGAGSMDVIQRFSGALLIDDPNKVDDCYSDVKLEKTIRYYEDTLLSRLNSVNTPIIIIMQRIHENDLAGSVVNKEDDWTVLKMPVIVDGKPLWEFKHDMDAILKMQKRRYVFASQYMQEPSPLEGGMFNKESFGIVNAMPSDDMIAEQVRGWDLAATKDGDGAYTVGAKIIKTTDNRYIVVDIVRLRGNPHEVEKAIKNTAALDGQSVMQSIPQDPGQAGKAQKDYLSKVLSGYVFRFSPESGSKEDRARPLSSQVEAGNVSLLKASWNTDFLEEAKLFPNSKYKDQIDACSRAFSELTSSCEMDIFSF